MSAAARSLAPWRWLGVPLVQVILLTILFGVPLRVFQLQLPEPVFAVWPVFAWAVIRPSILAPFAVLLLGLFLDSFWGAPNGFWALALLIGYGAVLGARSMILGQSEPMMWFWFAAMTMLVLGAGYVFSVFKTGAAPGLLGVFWQFLATILLYPLSHRLIERFEDADVRFR